MDTFLAAPGEAEIRLLKQFEQQFKSIPITVDLEVNLFPGTGQCGLTLADGDQRGHCR